MPEANTYQDIWIRWIHSTWENQNAWRTDIRPSVLNDLSITKALFVLDDGTCVFVPTSELRRALANKQPNNNGSIIFNVQPHSKKIDEVKVEMEVKQSKRTQAAEHSRIIENLLS